ncbi:hypothetical protein UY3_10849 [Chelonia mydas]|uniref:Uncharacterized protein n=1 Tax=Chelonia mydas TaxID=8469 RepID=M7BIY9_CHEMY|nr:hypothetical protein UY3_10849 [Chelonia mydas]
MRGVQLSALGLQHCSASVDTLVNYSAATRLREVSHNACSRLSGHRFELYCPALRVKVKDLRNAYHRVWEANCCSGAEPMSCRFHKMLDAVLGSDPTSTVKATVDTLVAHVPVKSGPSQEQEILDKNVEGEGGPRDKKFGSYSIRTDLNSSSSIHN